MTKVPAAEGPEEVPAVAGAGRGGPLRVLILEDNVADAGLLQASLRATQDLRVHLEWFDRLERGLDRLAEGGIDVSIVDLSLPDSTGLDTFRAVRDQAPEVPLLILTGAEDENLGVVAISEGAQDYLVKGEQWPGTLGRALRYAVARQAMVGQLRQLALVDELTGLHNRRGFVGLASQLLKVAGRNGLGTTLLYMDIDGLKDINDTYGHHRGDDVFVAIADRFRQSFRASDVVARVGGDEFCALLVADGSQGSLPLSRLLEEPVVILSGGGPPLAVALSVGRAHCAPGEDMGIEELMQRADAAMYEAKQARRSGGPLHLRRHRQANG
ncbi:MAG TPA: diguanylate cyclase [Acidimicrobiales bacterium]|nr:diguanylate cyclase [Acidimicrobiales bacterium]